MFKALSRILDLAPETIDVVDQDGLTPLMLAAAGGHLDAINALLTRGASREIRNSKGQTAAEIAQGAGHLEAAAALA